MPISKRNGDAGCVPRPHTACLRTAFLRSAWRHAAVLLAGLALLPASAAPAEAQTRTPQSRNTDIRDAQVRLDARYTASLAGIPLGKGSWVIHIGSDRYSTVVNGSTTGILNAFASTTGSGLAQGRILNGHLVPASYVVSTTSKKKTETIRINLAGRDVESFSIEPEEPPNPERIPVTEIHRRGVSDPMTASLVRGAGGVSAEACQGSVAGSTSGSTAGSTAIFDGRMRYKLRLAFKRIDKVKAEKGYQGPVVVCAIFFTPVAGYVPDRAAIKYLAAQRDMEVWLAPVGDKLLVPFRVTIPTPLGTGLLEATDFVVTTADTAAQAQPK